MSLSKGKEAGHKEQTGKNNQEVISRKSERKIGNL